MDRYNGVVNLPKSELRMNSQTFDVLREMVRDIGGFERYSKYEFGRNCSYAHHKEIRSIKTYFNRSSESVSRQFNLYLLTVLKLHHRLLKKPTPIPEDSENNRRKFFKNCLGALDGIFVRVHVANEERGRYRTRKGNLAMNVLGVCTPKMEFVFILPGWECSAHDGRVLREAISKPNGIKVPKGCYYLVDARYTNCEDF
ncbi:uncharacterized protein LOC141638288 [Silene latifolia]|uniref:uncharacterized protein LOC141638288 n=1 Tax=Silene latifolia TaxID=37657 RepID=UPI003D782D74